MDRCEQHGQAIPLRRLNTREENRRRQHMRLIFDKYDTDSDGYLNVTEMKRLIKDRKCPDMPKDLAIHLLKASDTNNDGRLDFAEFYKLSTEHPIFLFEMYLKYCKAVVPKRNVAEEGDVIDGEYEQSMKLWPPPLMMIIFSILEVIFFVIDIVKTQDHNGTSTNGPMATLFIYNPHLRHEAWRFLTYMFVHIGFMHLVMNLLVQILLGVALELVHCWWRVALVYLAGVIAGSMGTSIFTPRVFLAGASGGVYALITAHISTIIMNWKQMEYAIVQLFVFLVFCVTDLGVSIYNSINDPFDKVGYIAHASGAVAGFLVGIGVLRNLKVESWERKLWWCAVTVYFLLMIAGIMYHFLDPSHFY
ncbi:rhomboid-related protein 2 [Anopheles moucheti]|uniref:rhomboid-related protein 2 n=1 Tax=Anopheles moucheti TaxID=186751 RepID=UPI0022F0CBBB|nr:rhomboid-related protein 2 [Anopheles moucheti]